MFKTVKAVVLSVKKPKVAQVEGETWYEVQVVYPKRKFGRIYRERTTVFITDLPQVHTEIDVEIEIEEYTPESTVGWVSV